MSAVLDTSVAIHLRDGTTQIIDKVDDLGMSVALSVVTHIELEGGVYRNAALAQIRRTRLDEILSVIPVLPFNGEAARAYGQIVARAGYSRRKVLDRMIAAQAIVHRATLVTLNPQDFADVPGLQVLGW